ncbi:MAG: hypothetical protein JO053_01450 [Acidobacteria bacterium]|nr:hypothetical protein [Acidobacteriota bacterium]
MKAGDEVHIKAVVLRVEPDRIDLQTPSGKLVQTVEGDIVAAAKEIKGPITLAGGAIEHNVKKASKGKQS